MRKVNLRKKNLPVKDESNERASMNIYWFQSVTGYLKGASQIKSKVES